LPVESVETTCGGSDGTAKQQAAENSISLQEQQPDNKEGKSAVYLIVVGGIFRGMSMRR
jgi:hypothetical protein